MAGGYPEEQFSSGVLLRGGIEKTEARQQCACNVCADAGLWQAFRKNTDSVARYKGSLRRVPSD